jgi:hypothetical protein
MVYLPAPDRASPAPPREVCMLTASPGAPYAAFSAPRRAVKDDTGSPDGTVCTGNACLPGIEFDCARTSLDPTSPLPLPAPATVAIATIDYVKKPSCIAKSRSFQQLDHDGHRTTLVGAPLRSRLCRRLRSPFVRPSPTPRAEQQTAVAANQKESSSPCPSTNASPNRGS